MTWTKHSFNLSRRLEIRSRLLVFQQEKYKRKARGQLEDTHTANALKLSRNFGTGFGKDFKLSLECSEGQRLARDDLIQGREYSNREAASYQGSAEASKRDAAQQS